MDIKMKKELIKIIKDAGKILKEGFYTDKNISFKAKKDLVTQFDVAVEEYMKKKSSVNDLINTNGFSYFIIILIIISLFLVSYVLKNYFVNTFDMDMDIK